MEVVAEHPNELVRDQYLMQVADRCRVDPQQLRSGAWRSWAPGSSGSSRSSVRPGVPSGVGQGVGSTPFVVAGAELEALRLRVHHPDVIADRLQAVFFDDDLCLRAYQALDATATLHDAIAAADPEIADLLQRLAVQDTDDDPDEVIIRLIERAGKRAWAELEREARQSSAPRVTGR